MLIIMNDLNFMKVIMNADECYYEFYYEFYESCYE